jgi:hypothetical protein
MKSSPGPIHAKHGGAMAAIEHWAYDLMLMALACRT